MRTKHRQTQPFYRLHALMVLVVAGFISAPTTQVHAAAAQNILYLTTYDQVLLPNSVTTLRAKVEVPVLLRPDIHLMPVQFYINGTYLGKAMTKGDGYAYLKWRTPAKPGNYNFTVKVLPRFSRYLGIKEVMTPGLLAVRSKQQQFLITDIDHTISDHPELLVATTSNSKIKAMEGSVQALKHFDSYADIIYISARDDYFIRKTKQWLQLNGFPNGVVFTRDWSINGDNSETFKFKKIQKLKSIWGNIFVGVGDKRTDGAAYLANGLVTYLLHNYMEGAITVNSWKEILQMEQRRLRHQVLQKAPVK